MRIHRRNLPRCSYTTNVKFKFPNYSGDIHAYVKDNKSIIMLNYSSFCRFVLAMMREKFSCRFKFPTQVEFEDNMRQNIKDNLYMLTVLSDHMNKVEREAIDENAVQTIIYNVFDDTVGYDIYLRIHHSIQDIKDSAPSPTKSVFKIAGLTPREVFVHPCDYFNASFIRGKKQIQCISYEGNIWYRFTDFNRMFDIQRTNLISNKINVNDFVIYDGFLFCNNNEVKDTIMKLNVSKEDKAKYLEAFEISTSDLTKSEEDKSFTVNVANEEAKILPSELEISDNKIIVPVEFNKLNTKDKPKKGMKHTVKINIHEGKPNIIEEDRMVTVMAKVDKEVRDKAMNLFNDLGLDMQTAISIYLHQCIMKNGIPFEIKKELIFETKSNVQEESDVQEVHDAQEVLENNPPVIISTHEAAKIMNISYANFMYYLKKYNDLPVYHEGSKNIIRIDKAKFEEWRERHLLNKEDITENNFTMAEAVEFSKVNRIKFTLLRKFKGFPEIKETGYAKYINKTDLKEWIANNHNLVYGKSMTELKRMLNINEKEEDNFSELLENHNIENNNLVAFTIDRKFITEGRRPAIYEKNYKSAMGSKIFNVIYEGCSGFQAIADRSYKYIKPVYKDYDLTMIDKVNLKISKDICAEFILVKDNNAAEHGIGSSLPYDYIFVRSIDFINAIIDFEDKEINKAKAYCSLIANDSGIETIRLNNKNGNRTKYMQINDIDQVFNYITTKKTLADKLKYDSTHLIKKIALIELDEYIKKNRHNIEFRRRIMDYVDDFYRAYKNGVVDNMARHIFSDKTIKELLNSKDVGEFTYGNIIVSEALRNLLGYYRIAHKNNPSMPAATGMKPTNTVILGNVWDFINKSEYLTEVHRAFIEASQAMEQRYNELLENYNKFAEEGYEIESVFDE